MPDSSDTTNHPDLPATWRGVLLDATRRLADAGVPEPRRSAEWIVLDVLGCSRVHLLAYPERHVTAVQRAALDVLLMRRLRREPVQYVVGHAEFFGLRLRVSPDVLIPRPETEQVVEAALAVIEAVPAPRVLDVGTGSGCIPLAVKHERPDARVAACDVSPEALAVARTNAEALGLAVTLLEADMLAPDFAAHMPDRLDLLISNPPYLATDEAGTLAPEVLEHEPHRALFAGPDPLVCYRALSRHAQTLLVPGGWLVFEVHALHGAAVRAEVEAEGFSAVRLQKDLAGLPRIVCGQWPGRT